MIIWQKTILRENDILQIDDFIAHILWKAISEQNLTTLLCTTTQRKLWLNTAKTLKNLIVTEKVTGSTVESRQLNQHIRSTKRQILLTALLFLFIMKYLLFNMSIKLLVTDVFTRDSLATNRSKYRKSFVIDFCLMLDTDIKYLFKPGMSPGITFKIANLLN